MLMYYRYLLQLIMSHVITIISSFDYLMNSYFQRMHYLLLFVPNIYSWTCIYQWLKLSKYIAVH